MRNLVAYTTLPPSERREFGDRERTMMRTKFHLTTNRSRTSSATLLIPSSHRSLHCRLRSREFCAGKRERNGLSLHQASAFFSSWMFAVAMSLVTFAVEFACHWSAASVSVL